MKTATQPAHTIRYGCIRIAIWRNEAPNGARYSTVIERIYRDDQGKAQSASSFGFYELGLIQLALTEAAQWMTAEKTREIQAEAV